MSYVKLETATSLPLVPGWLKYDWIAMLNALSPAFSSRRKSTNWWVMRRNEIDEPSSPSTRTGYDTPVRGMGRRLVLKS